MDPKDIREPTQDGPKRHGKCLCGVNKGLASRISLSNPVDVHGKIIVWAGAECTSVASRGSKLFVQ